MNWKKTGAFLLALLLVIGMQVWVGCEEDDETTDGEQANAFTDLTDVQQVELSGAAVEGAVGMLGTADFVADVAGSGEWPTSLWDFMLFSEGSGKDGIREISAPPDTSWDGPDAEGWYTYEWSMDMMGTVISLGMEIRWTPDIWDDANVGVDPTGLEFVENLGMFMGDTAEVAVGINAAVAVSTDRETVYGTVEYDSRYEEDTAGWSEMLVEATMTDVAVADDDFSANYTTALTLSADYTDPISGVYYGDELSLTSEFNIEADGSGTGVISCEGIPVIQIVFNTMTVAGTYEGYYTIITDGFQTQYPFPTDEE